MGVVADLLVDHGECSGEFLQRVSHMGPVLLQELEKFGHAVGVAGHKGW